jgi:hypothetical protein
MAIRPIFVPDEEKPPFVQEVNLEFTWHPGFALSQMQKSIASLHAAARDYGIDPILEISSRSLQRIGVELSAFNLMFKTKDGWAMSVECAFQGSKVFERGGPYDNLFNASSREAKKDDRLRSSGALLRFDFLGEDFPTKPLTAFYDWLYLNALFQNQSLAEQLLRYKGFTDIAFNPNKSINCQARAAALFVALKKKGEIEKVIKDKKYYLELVGGKPGSFKKQLPSQLIML